MKWLLILTVLFLATPAFADWYPINPCYTMTACQRSQTDCTQGTLNVSNGCPIHSVISDVILNHIDGRYGDVRLVFNGWSTCDSVVVNLWWTERNGTGHRTRIPFEQMTRSINLCSLGDVNNAALEITGYGRKVNYRMTGLGLDWTLPPIGKQGESWGHLKGLYR